MKQVLTFVLMAGMLVGAPGAFAEDTTTVDNDERPRTELLRDIRERQLENRERVRDTIMGVRDDMRTDHRGILRSAMARFQAAHIRMERAAERISTQIERFEVRGVETGDAATYVASAQEALDDAREVADEILTLVEEADLEDDRFDVEEYHAELRDLISQAKELLIEARDNLKSAVGELRAGIIAFRGDDVDEEVEENTEEEEMTEEEAVETAEEESASDETESEEETEA